MKSWAVCLVALATWVIAGEQDRPFETESAYLEDGALRFNPRGQIDWASMASEELRTLSIPNSDSDIVARLGPLVDMFGGVEVRSPVPIPDPLITRHFYFAGVDGVQDVTLDSINSVTRLTFNRQGTRVERRQSYGEVFGTPRNDAPLSGGGLILHSERPLVFLTSPSNVTADDLLLGSTTVQQTPDGGYWGRGTAFWEIEAQYRIELEELGGEWIFVQWAPDREMIEAGCQYRYQLFRLTLGGPATQLGWTSYGCDV